MNAELFLLFFFFFFFLLEVFVELVGAVVLKWAGDLSRKWLSVVSGSLCWRI